MHTLCGAGEWLLEKHGTKMRRPPRHTGLRAGTGQIAPATLTKKDVDDGAEVGPLPDRIPAPLA